MENERYGYYDFECKMSVELADLLLPMIQDILKENRTNDKRICQYFGNKLLDFKGKQELKQILKQIGIE